MQNIISFYIKDVTTKRYIIINIHCVTNLLVIFLEHGNLIWLITTPLAKFARKQIRTIHQWPLKEDFSKYILADKSTMSPPKHNNK